MDKAGAIKLCQLLNIDMAEKQSRTGYVIANCPLAPTRHLPHGYDADHGFAIQTGNIESRYRCFFCNGSGTLANLVNRLREQAQMYPNGEQFQEAMQLIAHENETVSLTLTMDDAAITGQPPPPSLPLSIMQGMKKIHSAQAFDYLQQRMITSQDINKFMLREDPQRQRIVIPTFDRAGNLALASGRSYVGQDPKYYFYTSEGVPHNNQVLYNENNVDLDKHVILVESYFDLYRVRQALEFDNIVAAINAHLSQRQQKTLAMAPYITTLFDSGTAGDNARWQVAQMGKPCTQLQPPQGQDGGSMTHADIIALFDS